MILSTEKNDEFLIFAFIYVIVVVATMSCLRKHEHNHFDWKQSFHNINFYHINLLESTPTNM